MTTVFLTSASTSPFTTPVDFAVTAPTGPASLTHFDGTNGSTSFPDDSGNMIWLRSGTTPPVVDTSQSKFGGASGHFQAAGRLVGNGSGAARQFLDLSHKAIAATRNRHDVAM